MAPELSKSYLPQQVEQRWADFWAAGQLFRADVNAPGPVFSIVIPPPNVTGSLHLGHMFDHTEIDILTRWKRMCGFNTLYLPGTDHAGISTQRVVVRNLADQGIDYRSLGREAFEKKVWEWKQASGNTITQQMRQIGETCDWSRERFTMEPALSRAVLEVFVRLYEEGLIYRGHYMVNWCPQCRTAISDLETIHIEHAGHLWHIRYPVAGKGEDVVVATTRPETMLGDTGVAVHPDDDRYRHLVGRKIILPLLNREIPVVADSFVDREFGSGAVKVTPAHDPNDFECGRRHSLPELDVMTDDGRMSKAAGPYAGLDRFEARMKIVEDLKAQGLLERVTTHSHALGTCDRCKTIIEPRAKTQWFVRMKPLAEPAIAAVERGDIALLPENKRTEYFEWMRNIRDWCISRQLWWGHRIPAWHCAACSKSTVARETPKQCAHCGSQTIEQDPDVLDTWFSSALWPFSTLGWPDDSPDLRKYYPTSVMITGYDILFFWVARMIMMGLKFTGQVPFRRVFLHSLVRNVEGQKMSKSRGTGIDPVELNRAHGTDAMRFTMASLAAPGSDITWNEERLLSSRAFANKIWNAARFLFFNFQKAEATGLSLEQVASPETRAGAPFRAGHSLALVDRWIFSRLSSVSAEINDALENGRFHEAAHVTYQFFWGEFCDWYIELVKPQLSPAAPESSAAWKNIFAVFESALRLLHPMMPFLTEELWHQLPQRAGAKSIALERFPAARPEWRDAVAERQMALLQEIITAARNIRAELKLDPRRKVGAEISVARPETRAFLEANLEAVLRLSTLSALNLVAGPFPAGGAKVRSTADFDLRIAHAETLDVGAEIARLKKETDRLAKDVESKQARLADAAFRSRAPARVVQDMEDTLRERQVEHRKLLERLAQLESPGGARPAS